MAEMVESLLKTADLGKRTGGDVTAGLTKEKVTDRLLSCLASAEHRRVYCIMITGSEGFFHRIKGFFHRILTLSVAWDPNGMLSGFHFISESFLFMLLIKASMYKGSDS